MWKPKTTLRIVLATIAFAMAAAAQTKTDEGISFYQNGEYDKAIRSLGKALESDSGDQEARLYLAAAHVNRAEDVEALRNFRSLKAISNSGAPYDKRYERPLKIKKAPAPGYTKVAANNSTSGFVIVAAEFRADGTVGFVFPIQKLRDGLTEKAVEAARKIRFEPAVNQGKNLTVVRRIEFTFSSP